MTKYGKKPAMREPLLARAQLKADKTGLRRAIMARFAKALEYLAK